MANCKKCLYTMFSYSTPKILNVRSLPVGIVSRIVQLLILSYIIGYVLIYNKGYQDVCPVKSSVAIKVKGLVYANFTDEEFNSTVKHHELYNRIWDVADYVVPPSENGAAFVATNVIVTPNQTRDVCAEDITIPGAECHPDNNTCIEGKPIHLGNGVMTGKCIPFEDKGYSCEVHAWCPVERDVLPLINNTPLLGASRDFTMLIKNFVTFPKFSNSERRNIKDTTNITYLENCLYDGHKSPECPIFKLGDIVRWAGQDYNTVGYKGGVIAIAITWNCNFDVDKKYCLPTYSFSHLTDPHAQLAPGWNFRYAQYYSDDRRTLYKLYGIKFAILVEGQAGKFMIIPFLLNVGAGLGLLALEAVICDLVMLYLIKRRKYYKGKKYENADIEADYEILNAPSPDVSVSINETPVQRDSGDAYQRHDSDINTGL